MDPEVKELWLEALRGGEYKQGVAQLKGTYAGPRDLDYDEYCCLGVLCALYCEDQGTSWDSMLGKQVEENLPPKVCRWAKMDNPDPVIKEDRLSIHNDGSDDRPGKSFKQIANLIERYL